MVPLSTTGQEPTPGRYALHDLVRTHAAQLATTGPGPRGRHIQRRRAALTRLLNYYRRGTSRAMDIAYPHERVRRPRVPPAGTPVPDLPDPAAAVDWLDTELPNLVATAHHAARHGWPEHACQLSAILRRHLRARGQHRVAEPHRVAVAGDLIPGGAQRGMVQIGHAVTRAATLWYRSQ